MSISWKNSPSHKACLEKVIAGIGACAESFFGHFKSETIHLMKQKPENLKEVVDMIEDYMVYYIHERPQRKLGGKPPSL